jgi:hypothetical protein
MDFKITTNKTTLIKIGTTADEWFSLIGVDEWPFPLKFNTLLDS